MPGIRHVELVIVAAIALASPSIVQALNGGIAPATAIVRVVVALLVCWAGAAVVERITDNYSKEARQRELERRVEFIAQSRAEAVAKARAMEQQHGSGPGAGSPVP
jgi:predicted naringenin-chalcone synthase